MKSEATKNHKVIERDIGSIAKCIRDVTRQLSVISVTLQNVSAMLESILMLFHAYGGCNTT